MSVLTILMLLHGLTVAGYQPATPPVATGTAPPGAERTVRQHPTRPTVVGAPEIQHGPVAGQAAHASPEREALRLELEQRVADGRLRPEEAATILRRLDGMTHSGGDAVGISAAELEAAARLVAEVRQGAARLADVVAAEAEGYRPIPVGSRSGLVHYHNNDYYTSGRILDAARPEQVIYYRQPDGRQQLVGVMFLMPPGQPGPRIGGPLTAWHAHTDICANVETWTPAGATDAQGQCPPGTVQRTSPEMLHVWLIDNPRGVFDSWMQPDQLVAIAVD